jgi:hypothetical protein
MVQSFVICDRVLRDRFADENSLISLLQEIKARDFPAEVRHVCFFAELTSGHGETVVSFEVVDADERRAPVISARMGVPSPIHSLCCRWPCRPWVPCSRSPATIAAG